MTSLLLDTDAFIWWDADDASLGNAARQQIEDADDVYVSAASAWEIAIRRSLGKLRTTRQTAEAVSDGGFRALPVSFDHAEAVAQLPAHHSDPFDRLIVAVAKVEGLTIVTSDRSFKLYDVALVDARR